VVSRAFIASGGETIVFKEEEAEGLGEVWKVAPVSLRKS